VSLSDSVHFRKRVSCKDYEVLCMCDMGDAFVCVASGSLCAGEELTPEQLCQVVSVATDSPSGRLYSEVKAVCPQLTWVSLDPVHLVIVYEQSHFRKKTPGSSFLRRIMARFAKLDFSKDVGVWGEAYSGHDYLREQRHETTARNSIIAQSYSRARSATVEADFPSEEPYTCRFEFIAAIAALCTVYREEVVRMTHVNRQPLYRISWCATAPARVEWLYNNIGVRHSTQRSKLSLLASGTSPNESPHREMNVWFKN